MPLWRDSPGAWHEILPGVRRRVLSHGASAMLVLYRIEPGKVFPRHVHPHAQYGTVLEGGGVFVVGPRRWTLVVGDAYFVPPNVEHELTTDATAPTVILDVFSPAREDFLSEALPADEE
jgi:quercetin dioxygenase-like cupin family protein